MAAPKPIYSRIRLMEAPKQTFAKLDDQLLAASLVGRPLSKIKNQFSSSKSQLSLTQKALPEFALF